jgi:amino acid transporter
VVIVVGMQFWGSVNYLETPTVNGVAVPLSLSLVLQGAVLTFYSFVGFEDLLNISEEVKDAQRTFPKALIISLVITTVIYLAVSISAVSVVPYQELGESKRPLVDVVIRAVPGFPPIVFTLISLIAVMNTALMNHIMGSRLIYGMAKHRLLPSVLGKVHQSTQTPRVSILVITAIVLALALLEDISVLARATSILLLGVFTVVNLSLIVLYGREKDTMSFKVPRVIPFLGVVFCIMVGVHALRAEVLLSCGILLAIVVLYLVMRPKSLTEDDLEL